MWSVAGMAVSTHLFRNVAGEDRVWLTSEFLVIHRRAGLLRRITRVPRHDIRRISMTDRDRALAVYSSRGMETITTLGSPGEQRDLRATLMRQLELPDAAAVRELEQLTVPPQWETRRADPRLRPVSPAGPRPPPAGENGVDRDRADRAGPAGLGDAHGRQRRAARILPSLVTALCASGAMRADVGPQGMGRRHRPARAAAPLPALDQRNGFRGRRARTVLEGGWRRRRALRTALSTPYGDRKKIARRSTSPASLPGSRSGLPRAPTSTWTPATARRSQRLLRPITVAEKPGDWFF